jgi:FKBP-type peptidyl-prolyl cis-trans isomerase FklB
MQLRVMIAVVVGLVAGQILAQEKGVKPPAAKSGELKTIKDKASYAIGLQIGGNFRNQQIEIDTALLLQGIKDALADAEPKLTEKEIAATMQAFEKEVTAAAEARDKAAGEKNKKEGDAFLAANKKKEGVKALPSGLQYKVIKAGTGKKPTAKDFVKVNYRGTLINGKEFDSSAKHGGPVPLAVGRVIKGWVEALQMMPVGSKWQLTVPSELAYGDESRGALIGPNSTLLFELELLGIEDPKNLPPGAVPPGGDDDDGDDSPDSPEAVEQ